MEPDWLNALSTIAGVLGTAVIAIATVFLWLVTRNLARETARMVEASSRPHVVATIDPNRWSWMHADLRVDNTGNGTAYDAEVVFDPPLESSKPRRSGMPTPLQRISVLKPGQGMTSFLSEFGPLMGKTYTVQVSWRRDPAKDARETNIYTLTMSDLDGLSQLGPSDPLTQIAQQVKNIREDWQAVANGSNRIQADAFTSSDRLHERRQLDRLRRRRMRNQPL